MIGERETISLRHSPSGVGSAPTARREWRAERARPATPAAVGSVPAWLRVLGLLAWLGAVAWVWQAGLLRAYGDALAHETLARRVTDSLAPGLVQLGTVWLPLPSLVLVPLSALDPLWRSGLAGALAGGIYLQIAIGALYRVGWRLGGATAGVVAVVAFLANPNTLYLFTTPLTEAPTFAFGCLCAAGLAEALEGFREGVVRPGAILTAALAATATLLCRYDGWMLAVAGGAVLSCASLAWLRSWQKTEAVAIFYAVAPVLAIGFWLLYNWLIFGDPLAFQRGPYSSASVMGDLAARGQLPALNGNPINTGQPLHATVTYGQAVLENAGLVPLLLAACGAVVALLRARRRPAGLVLIALAAPLVFYILALQGGQAAIVTRAADQHGLLNLRYGDALAPAIALGIAALVGTVRAGAWRIAAPLALAAIVSGVLLYVAPNGPVALAEARLQGAVPRRPPRARRPAGSPSSPTRT